LPAPAVWLIAAAIMAITIIGIPWARAAFNIASYTFLPFGREGVPREEVTARENLSTGGFGVIGNVIWHPHRLVAGARPHHHRRDAGDHP
jgi:uncharacterized membrane protein YccF (DUF307 family)